MDSSTLSIVYACDNNFVPLLVASINSVKQNSKGLKKDIYIIDDGISGFNRDRIAGFFNDEDVTISFKPVKDVIPENVRIPYFNNARLPVTTFFRLFIHTFLPKGTEKVIYLDADTIVLENIGKLWATDISGYTAAAVQDPGIKTFDCSWGGGVRNYEELGFHGSTKYLNAGILLINLEKWIEHSVGEKALECAVKYNKHIVYGDQYCLNAVLGNKWLELNPLWNHLVDKFHEAPYILHYIGNKPIYTNYTYDQRYKNIFFDYLKETPWQDINLVGGTTRKITMVKRFIRKLVG